MAQAQIAEAGERRSATDHKSLMGSIMRCKLTICGQLWHMIYHPSAWGLLWHSFLSVLVTMAVPVLPPPPNEVAPRFSRHGRVRVSERVAFNAKAAGRRI